MFLSRKGGGQKAKDSSRKVSPEKVCALFRKFSKRQGRPGNVIVARGLACSSKSDTFRQIRLNLNLSKPGKIRLYKLIIGQRLMGETKWKGVETASCDFCDFCGFLRFPAVFCSFLRLQTTYLADQGPNLQKFATIFEKLPFLPFSLSRLSLPNIKKLRVVETVVLENGVFVPYRKQVILTKIGEILIVHSTHKKKDFAPQPRKSTKMTKMVGVTQANDRLPKAPF